MISTIAIVVAVVLVTLFIYAATRPATFRVQRTIDIAASPETVFPHINDFHQWLAWSPWEKMDPALKRTYRGAPSGKGAVYEWEGNHQVGQGRMEIIETTSPSKVVIKLDFFKPFEAHNQAEFTLALHGGSTNVSWVMHGPQPYMAKLMSIFIDCEKMVGPQFEAGLKNLKALAEQ